MSRAPTGLAHSVQVRLVRHAEEIGVDPNLVLTRYATERLDSGVLSRAIRATFARRRTVVPGELPIALTAEFGMLPEKQAQRAAFLRKGRTRGASSDFAVVVVELVRFLELVLVESAAAGDPEQEWLPGGPWRPGPSTGEAAAVRG